ncbi:MAG TPA: hypothetical protein PLT47_08045, partial [Bacteroidales bacterium]|nr:hypothetical protein [Bacteroidales bacterium]
MKKRFVFGFLLLLFLAFKTIAQQDTSVLKLSDTAGNLPADTSAVFPESGIIIADDGLQPEEPKLSINGYIQADDRLQFNGGKLNRQEYRLDVKLDYKPFDRGKLFTEVWLRAYKYPEIYTVGDLSDKKKILNFDADVREAYFDIYGLFTKNLDVRIGRQRIAWGTADRLNPTDNLNPYDMEDIWDFGRHLGSNAIKLTYYAGTFTF